MKKFLNSIVAAAALVATVAFAGCSNSVVDSNEAESSVSAARSAAATITLTSDLNPGYGKAVYFTGTFIEGKNWTTAVRGSYVDGQWTCDVTSYKSSFEYKALTGDWDNGETVAAEFTNLTKLGAAENLSGYQGMPSGFFVYDGSDVAYGDAVYFFFDDNTYSYALRGTYYDKLVIDYCPTQYTTWLMPFSNGFYKTVTAYVGSYDLGEEVYPTFVNLTWEAGENHVYE